MAVGTDGKGGAKASSDPKPKGKAKGKEVEVEFVTAAGTGDGYRCGERHTLSSSDAKPWLDSGAAKLVKADKREKATT